MYIVCVAVMAYPRLSASMLLASFTLLLYWTTSSAQSHHLTSDLSPPSRVKRDQPFETREKVKATFEVVTDTLSAFKELSEAKKWEESAKDVLKKLAKFASMAPGCVGVLFSVVNMALAFVSQDDPVLNAVKEGFAEVNRKLDSVSIQISHLATDVEWFNYASIYSQDEVRILSAWRKLNEFRENSELAQSQEDKLRQAEIFTNYYEYTGTEASVANLYHYLTVSSTSLTRNLNELLRKKFKCDIGEIGKYNFYFSSLLLQGTVLNEVYWKLIGFNPSNKEAEHAQMFKNVYRAQRSTVDFCLNNTEHYRKKDVVEISKKNSPDNKNAIAEQVKNKLDEKYDWYNWVVLVYNTDQDNYYKLHDLTKIYNDTITVAVGHTLKAKEVFKTEIIQAAAQCFGKSDCNSKDKLHICRFPRGQRDAHLFTDFVKVTHVVYGTEFAELPQPFHKVNCDSTGYVSMYFSRRLPVCSDGTCQNNGRCKRLLDSNDHLCECQDGYYGDTCEHKMDTSSVKNIIVPDPVPTITTTNVRMKMMESKLDQILKTINDRCRG